MRPALKAGLLPVWRDRDTVQIGIDPRRAVALTGMSHAAAVVSLLDGSREHRQVILTAAARGIPEPATEQVLALLAAHGALDDYPADTFRSLPHGQRGRIAAELATASLARQDRDGGAQFLTRRRRAVVVVRGSRRLGRPLARILAASGIGRVAAATGAGDPVADGRVPHADLVVLAGRCDSESAAALVRARTPHLAVSAAEAIGVVGPLVVPRRTACLRCVDHTKASCDSAWPLILAQLAARRGDPVACDSLLAAAVAAQAAAQVLAAIDGGEMSPPAVNGTLELVLPGWQWRRRTWRPHPACTCGSYSTA